MNLYGAMLAKKKRLFQKPFEIKDGMIYITDTIHAKKKFIKSGIRDVVFGSDVGNDKHFCNITEPVWAYEREFVLEYLDKYIVNLMKFFKMNTPVDEIAVTGKAEAECAAKYAKVLTLIGADEDYFIDGIFVRCVKKITRAPSFAVITEGKMPQLIGVPIIDLREKAVAGHNISTWETMSFKTNLLPFDISAAALMYFLKRREVEYELTSLRKKSPLLFTFC